MTIDQALAAPRVHHQWSPDVLAYEEAMSDSVVQQLSELGHKLEKGKALAVAQGIQKAADGMLRAASDPRVPSQAAGV